MKKAMFALVSVAFLFLVAAPSPSSAAYDSTGDTTINLNLLNGSYQPDGSTANTSFQLQEALHNTLTETTGIELDHSYIWIEVNGIKVLAVDPIKPTI